MVDDLKIAGWGRPPAELSLEGDEVHVWRGTVRASHAELKEMLPAISRSERKEADHHDQPKAFLAGRFMLRSLLARYLGGEPGSLELLEGPGGRLVAADAPQGPPHWDFDWGASRAIFAISASQPLAVHLDVVPVDLQVGDMARDMPPREASLAEFLSPQSRARAVVGYHAEREAARRLAVYRGDPGQHAPEGRIERLRLGKRFVAALAAEGWDWSPSFWTYGPGDNEGGE